MVPTTVTRFRTGSGATQTSSEDDMSRSRVWISCLAIAFCSLAALPSLGQQPTTTAPPRPALDFEFFRSKVQPIFIAKREGHARCIACHAAATGMRLQPLPAGSSTWSEADSRTNFDSVRRMVVPGSLKSRLLMHPLATDAGGDFFHNGGKQFPSQSDPEWSVLKDWVMGAKAGNTGQ
jgi:hypothetical protein